MADHKDIMVSFVPDEVADVLFMLEDYIQKAEDNITMFGDPEDDIDKEVQEVMQTHLAVACRLYDRLENELETLKHGGGGAS